MATRAQVLAMVDNGVPYAETARRLGIAPGLAYLIATGLPADGSDALAPEDLDRPGFVGTSTQGWSNAPVAENPTRNPMVLDWIKQRAHNDPQMLEAAARRDASPGEILDPDDDHDVVTVLTRDHNQVTALVEQLSAIPGHKQGGSTWQIGRRESIVDMISRALAQHESAEQQHLWPTARELLPDGAERAGEALRQEQDAAETLAALGKTEPDSEAFDDLVEKLVLQTRKHVAFEEQVFLALRRAMDDDDRQKLGKKLRVARSTAPTRPHPDAPTSPAAAVKAAGAPAAVLDKARDATRRRPAARKGKAPGEAQAKRREAAEARREEDES